VSRCLICNSHFDKLVGKDLELALEQQKIFISSIFIDEASSELCVDGRPITDILEMFKEQWRRVNLKFMWDLVARIRLEQRMAMLLTDK